METSKAVQIRKQLKEVVYSKLSRKRFDAVFQIPHLHMAGESGADGKQNMPSVLSVHFQQFQRLQSAKPSLMLMACLPGFCEQKAQSCKVFRSIRGISLLCTVWS